MRKLVLASFALVALVSACKDDPIKTVPARQGARGESCLVTNDCKSGLLCIAGRCIDGDFALEATSKVCVSAACIDTKDCCLPPSESQLERCTDLKIECNDETANGNDFGSCRQYQQNCGPCTATCTNHSCVGPADSVGNCTRNSDCGTDGVCDAGNCVECGSDTDCDQGFVCDENFCRRGCIRDEACGALSACNGGHCEPRDCKDDRECVAFTGRPDGVCAKSGKCSIPCDNDGGCAVLGPLLACVEGSCTYAGCQTNAECAAAHNDRGLGALLLCLEQTEADKVTFSGR